MNSLLMGIPGVGEIYPGIHLCALFSGPVERDRLLAQFLHEGLRRGDQCVCFIDGIEPVGMRQRAYRGADAADDLPGRLDMYSAPDAHLNAGLLSPRQIIAGLIPTPAPSADPRLPLLRAAGQMPTDGSGETAAGVLHAYETAVILILAELPTVFLCLYDMRRFGVRMLAEALKVHSRVLIDGMVLYNPHSIAPAGGAVPAGSLGPPDTPAGRGYEGDPWRSLTGTEVRVAGLIGTGMTNRATAAELIVSPHTVDAHLKHIYQKLGIHTRAELAVLSFRHGPPDAQRPPGEAGS